MNVLLGLVLVAMLILLMQLIRMASDLRRIRDILADMQFTLFSGGEPRTRRRRMGGGWGHPHGSQHVGLGFFTIWEWRDGNWKLKSAVVPPGIDPGAPPSHRGSFEGDHVKKWVPKT